jgi:RsiW-degrading membrane proteinase PrsW (M82 family)
MPPLPPIDALSVAIIAFAPGIFWLWYFYRRDTCSREPRALIIRTFLFGMASTAPAAVIEMLFGTYLVTPLILAVIVAPVVEELVKFSVVRYTVFEEDSFNQIIQGIVYGVAAALGFASIENGIYVVRAFTISSAAAAGTFAFRAITSVPAHALISGVWGYSLGVAKLGNPQIRGLIIASGLLMAFVLHGFFNLLAADQFVLSLLVLLFAYLPILWFFNNRNIMRAVNACTRIRTKN